jgi:hypothetical protein
MLKTLVFFVLTYLLTSSAHGQTVPGSVDSLKEPPVLVEDPVKGQNKPVRKEPLPPPPPRRGRGTSYPPVLVTENSRLIPVQKVKGPIKSVPGKGQPPILSSGKG